MKINPKNISQKPIPKSSRDSKKKNPKINTNKISRYRRFKRKMNKKKKKNLKRFRQLREK
jgi:hypothetical protein